MLTVRTATTGPTFSRCLVSILLGLALHFVLIYFLSRNVADNVAKFTMLSLLFLKIEPRGSAVSSREWGERTAAAALYGAALTVAFLMLDALPRIIALLGNR